MEQKRVSFEMAKAIKEAGYPQWSVEEADDSKLAYNCVGELWEIRYFDQNPQDYYTAPTYLDVWLWLWREKKIYLSPRVIQKDETIGEYTWLISPWDIGYIEKSSIYGFHDSDVRNPYEIMNDVADPEEAIIAAIEHLVDNGLIK